MRAGAHGPKFLQGTPPLMLVMIFTFAALPVITVPGWFAGLGRAFPPTADVVSLYGVMLGHRGVTGLWGTGGLLRVAVTGAAYLAAGITAFRVMERIAKARGTLGAY
jgi:ABC-2 type transport system permease protein